MFLARIDGTVTSTVKHASLARTKLLIGQRLDADGQDTGEPMVVLDDLGADRGCLVLVSTDGDRLRRQCGNNVPARNSVVGIVDRVTGGAGGRP